MKVYSPQVGLAAVLLALIFVGPIGKTEGQSTKKKESMKIASSAFQEGGNIPSKFTCDGQDINPALRFEDVPPEAKSLLLIVDDPDAPSGLFRHWLVWNIDPGTREISEHGAPANAEQGTNDFPKRGYGGPCPPSGTHRYFFKIFALDRKLNLPAGAKRNALEKEMNGHVLAQGQLMGRYARKK
jgi:Raf kinase inhibitor-like YbhB/YbcL family protein